MMDHDTNIPTILKDHNDPSAIRIEFVDDDGGVEVAIFSGPRAVERALALIKRFYGSSFDDPDRLLTQ
jgi:hypothetical protein